MSKCSIHENGYEDYICDDCKRDPVNSDWNDGNAADAYLPMGETRPSRVPSKLVRATRALMADPETNRTHLAKSVGVSRRTVTKAASFARKIGYMLEVAQGGHSENGNTVGELIARAWFEWKVNNRVLDIHIPRWFREEELGFRLDCGPSLQWHCENLQRINRTACVMLGSAAPKRVTYPKNFRFDARPRNKR